MSNQEQINTIKEMLGEDVPLTSEQLKPIKNLVRTMHFADIKHYEIITHIDEIFGSRTTVTIAKHLALLESGYDPSS